MSAGLIVEDGVVVETAPILGWTKGKRIDFIEDWVRRKKGKIEKI